MARFALDTIDAANDTLIDEEAPEMGPIVIRVGFHSGPLVAHVVGTRTPHFTILGGKLCRWSNQSLSNDGGNSVDTVNTASRMESNSKPGRVQCSEETMKLLEKETANKPEFHIECRGVIPIKGKGEMATAFINRKTK